MVSSCVRLLTYEKMDGLSGILFDNFKKLFPFRILELYQFLFSLLGSLVNFVRFCDIKKFYIVELHRKHDKRRDIVASSDGMCNGIETDGHDEPQIA